MKQVKFLATAMLAGLMFTGCSSDDDSTPEHIHGNEEIHEITITKTDADGSNVESYSFHAGDAIADDVITLSPNSTYHFEVTELNTHGENDAEENIIGEIIEEKEAHFFIYEKTNSADFSITRKDDASTTRADGNKLGKKIDIMTGDASTGTMTITLKHEATDVDGEANNGFGAATGGSSDLVANYSIVIQ